MHIPTPLHGRSRSSSQVTLLANQTPPAYILKPYWRRWIANTFGPPLLTVFYLLIARYYLCIQPVGEVISPPLIGAKVIYYAWLILSIFALDWAKSGLAGFEAWALMDRRFAPCSALQLMWHADRAWGSVSGWRDALLLLCVDLRRRFSKRPSRHPSAGPGGLWWFLAFSSFLFYAAIPLSSLTMEMSPVYKVGSPSIVIIGPNETTFDISTSNMIAEQANSRWRQGNPTTPFDETVLYGPGKVANGSNTYYWDSIQEIYREDVKNASNPAREVSFFSGPKVSERADGSAWGLLTILACSIVGPQDESFRLLKVRGIDDWSAPGLKSTLYGTDFFKQLGGYTPSLFNDGIFFGVNYAYLIASDLITDGTGTSYTDSSPFPVNGTLELVLWQTYNAPFAPDDTFRDLTSHPAVSSSVWRNTSTTYKGFGLTCSVNSSTGTARLDAATRSYSNFTSKPSTPQRTALIGFNGLNSYSGVQAIQNIVFASFTTAVLGILAPLACDDTGGLSSVTCNPFYGANVATGGIPVLVHADDPDPQIQYSTISPTRLKLAVHKLFGEAAIAMMAQSAGEWEGELHGLDRTTALIPGVVPWQVVLALLSLWSAVTTVPSLWAFGRKRWADTLSGFEMFRFGAEWREAVWHFEENEFVKCPVLLDVPGLVGDMERCGNKDGFIGLSMDEAKKDGKFVFTREVLGRTGS